MLVTLKHDRWERQPAEINGIAHIVLTADVHVAHLSFHEKRSTHRGPKRDAS